MALLEPELARRALARALERGGDLAEAYAERRHSFSLLLDDGRVERPLAGNEAGASIRVVRGDATYFGHVDGLGEEALLRVAGSVAEAVGAERREPGALAAPERRALHPVAQPPEQVEAARKAELLRACDERARSHGGR